MDPHVNITFELHPVTALALAQFAKRITWQEMRTCAIDDQEAYDIRQGIFKLQNALADAGYAPR